jgi:hypothetical protein
MIRTSTGHYIVFCSDCLAHERVEVSAAERTVSLRLAVQALMRRRWRQTEPPHILLPERALGAGTWECPWCAGKSGAKAVS